MWCQRCEGFVKMKCVFTKQQGKGVRYRVYLCPECRRHDESLEVVESKITSEEAKAALREAREDRFRLMHRVKSG